MIAKSPIADIYAQARSHYAMGNHVYLLQITRQGQDKDLGIQGDVTETKCRIEPEPMVNAVSDRIVAAGAGTVLWSDLRMNVPRESLEETTALSKSTEFEINEDRYMVITVRPGPTAWEFILRRKVAEPVVP